ncbi:NUDIX hydrolase [Candidatus Nomurabacteria bacterium]|nr:NUDIX hydrolase [Candidatus Nomurabacteria bacterium]
MQKRTKHPYFGYWGFPTGKVRWGETLLEAAARELKEETNLTAKFKYVGLYHELVRIKENGDIIEDKLFHIIGCSDVSGELLNAFEGGLNEWKTREAIEAEPKKYDSYKIEMDMIHGLYATFVEQTVEVSENDF